MKLETHVKDAHLRRQGILDALLKQAHEGSAFSCHLKVTTVMVQEGLALP